MSCRCKHCQTDLDDSAMSGDPCPQCKEPLLREFLLHAATGCYETVGNSLRGILGAAYTGRSIDVEGEFPIAKEWKTRYEQTLTPDLKLENELVSGLSVTNVDVKASYFRGRFFSHKPRLEEFGPPPAQMATMQRYNWKGTSALYLSSSIQGVRMEMTGKGGSDEELWIKDFRLPSELRLADARNLDAASLTAATFWVIESDRHDDMPPALGSRIGEILSLDFDGLIVPGVRGSPEIRYENVIIFHPHPRWQDYQTKDFPARWSKTL